MKYQPRNDVLDPDVRPPEWAFHDEESVDPDAQGDAYVIGSDGELVQEPNATNALGITAPAPPKPWVKPTAWLLGVAFLVLTAWNVSRFFHGPPAPPVPNEFQLKQALYLGVMKVENYRRTHGVTPDSLGDLDLPPSAYGYQRTDSQNYVLSFQNNGPKMEYDSRESKEDFFGKPQKILSMGGPK